MGADIVRKKVRDMWRSIGDGLSIYFLAVLGVFMAPYINLMDEGQRFTIELDWNVAVVSLVIGLMVVWSDERGGDIDGKLKNWTRRAKAALFAGAFWYAMMG
jgi:hypothetical protein